MDRTDRSPRRTPRLPLVLPVRPRQAGGPLGTRRGQVGSLVHDRADRRHQAGPQRCGPVAGSEEQPEALVQRPSRAVVVVLVHREAAEHGQGAAAQHQVRPLDLQEPLQVRPPDCQVSADVPEPGQRRGEPQPVVGVGAPVEGELQVLVLGIGVGEPFNVQFAFKVSF